MTNDDVAVETPSDEASEERPDRSLAEQLVDQARADGKDLVGPGGLLSDLTKQVLETGLEVEMDDHVGYPKHASEGRNGENSRNGTRSKTETVGVSSRSAQTLTTVRRQHPPAYGTGALADVYGNVRRVGCPGATDRRLRAGTDARQLASRRMAS